MSSVFEQFENLHEDDEIAFTELVLRISKSLGKNSASTTMKMEASSISNTWARC